MHFSRKSHKLPKYLNVTILVNDTVSWMVAYRQQNHCKIGGGGGRGGQCPPHPHLWVTLHSSGWKFHIVGN